MTKATNIKLMLVAGAAALIAPALAPASAQTGLYGNLGYTQYDGNNVDPGAITGRVGMDLHKYFAIEGEASTGVKKDNGVKIQNEFGVFGVGKLPITDRFDLFARAGVTTTNISAPGAGTRADEAFAYGAGGQYFFTDKDGIRLDWTKNDFNHGGDVDTYAASYVRKF